MHTLLEEVVTLILRDQGLLGINVILLLSLLHLLLDLLLGLQCLGQTLVGKRLVVELDRLLELEQMKRVRVISLVKLSLSHSLTHK